MRNLWKKIKEWWYWRNRCPVCGGSGLQFTETTARYGDDGTTCDTCGGTGRKR